MKKTLIIALVMTMLFGCGKSYRINYADCEDMFDKPAQSGRTGSRVTLKLHPVMDASVTVYVDGERILSSGQKGKFIIYKFRILQKENRSLLRFHWTYNDYLQSKTIKND